VVAGDTKTLVMLGWNFKLDVLQVKIIFFENIRNVGDRLLNVLVNPPL
jgi:hypothetical protein